MQTDVGLLGFQIILAAVVFQFMWMTLIKRAQDTYVVDITHFRPPSSRLSSYYEWRISDFGNILLEIIIYHVLLVTAIVLLTVPTGLLGELGNLVVVFFIIFTLSLLSSGQMLRRVRQIITREQRIVFTLNAAEDKIGRARTIVEDLYQGHEEGHIWFALFKVAQMKDPIGYSVRDVLIEKGKELAHERQDTLRRAKDQSGPSIE
jgi:hypothetical protein